MTKTEKLAIGHCNIQGGLTGLAKSLEIQELIKNEKLDILGLNETNLKPDIDTDTLNLPQNYTLVRKDRINNSGRGGCAVLISNNIKFRQLDVASKCLADTKQVEAIWLHIESVNMYICCFYTFIDPTFTVR